ncbi:DNA repair protein RadA [Thermosediminibacter litoriperuensis]|uniref:DNA repair protein RadA n=1 Tax=Thermosediminibacter litoriperuensis TaxID=291989 RepID=A0A5S5AHE2_9FIRM|nr:DNA repair protein RadA [Thermosediminibacter litoriperuensis]TYP48156.1 DNA repair protein RadA/Sms [Thermosediminibacter litoriperuensis]
MKSKRRFVCQQCGFESIKWMGRCPECDSWNSFAEEPVPSNAGVSFLHEHQKPRLLSEIDYSEEERIKTGLAELDRVLGGGIVPGSLVLVGGDPGIGKSTLMLQAGAKLGATGKIVLYVTGEESSKQVKLRAERLGISGGYLYIVAENDLDVVERHVRELLPQVVIIDSIQTAYLPQLESAPGSISQVREATLRLLKLSKETGTAVFIVGHVTKEGSLAGPRTLEHMVDCVLYFEGERYQSYRVLRAVKNRFGSTNEIGIFEMQDSGLAEVDSPSKFLLSGRPGNSPGSAVVCTMEGTRPLLVEVQALTCPTGFNLPRRQTSGIDYNRAALLIAVLEKKLGLNLAHEDVYINAAGGIKLSEPAVDLAVITAIVSSFKNKPVRDVVIIGEVGLAGEVRSVGYIEKRVTEAAKLGFKEAIIPYNNMRDLKNTTGIQISGVKELKDAVEAAFD